MFLEQINKLDKNLAWKMFRSNEKEFKRSF